MAYAVGTITLSSTGFTANLYRTNTTGTGYNWIAIYSEK